MQIAILTFQRAYNYGTVFQAYALQCVLKDLSNGCVKIIDYECPYINNVYRPTRLDRRNNSLSKALLKAVLQSPTKIRRFFKFNRFVENLLCLTRKVDDVSIKSLNDEYDFFIVGSDQVWNDDLTNSDRVFYLDFVSDRKKKFAYSASFGFPTLRETRMKEISGFIRDFSKVSVREDSAAKIVFECREEYPPITLDPTLLVDSSVWSQLARNVSVNGKYILIYTVQPPVQLIDFAFRLREKTGLKIIYLNDQIRKIKGIQYKKGVSPEEFLGYFKDAEYVLSNSFHGTVFSIIFKKKFFVELSTKTQTNIRSEDLLKHLDLSSRSELNIENIEKPINWTEVDKRLDDLRSYSIGYLQQIIN